MNNTKAYNILHCETWRNDWNSKRLLQGQTDIPLNANGEKQAENLAQVLHDVNFDLAFFKENNFSCFFCS